MILRNSSRRAYTVLASLALALLLVVGVASAKTPVGKLSVSPASLKFPTVVGGKSTNANFVVSDTGSVPLSGSVGSPTGADFTLVSGAGALNLTPGGTPLLSP